MDATEREVGHAGRGDIFVKDSVAGCPHIPPPWRIYVVSSFTGVCEYPSVARGSPVCAERQSKKRRNVIHSVLRRVRNKISGINGSSKSSRLQNG